MIEGLQRMGWSEADLRAQRKGEPRKVDSALAVAVADDDAAGLDSEAAEPGHPRSSAVVAAATGQEPARRPRQPTTAKNMTIALTAPFMNSLWWNC